jgi:hypothetical protein
VVCHSGVGLTPVVDGELHHYSAGGLYDGLVLLIDDETRTYWDHITGEALHGPLRGKQLAMWPIHMATVASELAAHPDTAYARSNAGLLGRAFGSFVGGVLGGGILGKGRLPPGFTGTMGAPDTRREAMEHGLGVVVGERARYYPMTAARQGLIDDWDGRSLRVATGPDGIPCATWEDEGDLPVQLFTRWYGFSFTFPGCEVYSSV